MDLKSDPKMDQLRKVSSQRLPPPVLFQGPPSHNASNLSLQPSATSAAATPGGSQPPPLQRTRSGRLDTPGTLSPFLSRTQSKGEVDRSDAIWQEMQSALSEVELSAVMSEHVFGEKHSEALEDLRMKQLKLAQAWARSEADDEVVESKNKNTAGKSSAEPPKAAESVTSGTETASLRNLDEETENDILLARERRVANDRYFDRVNNGVLDVVAQLEEVSQAMRAVEMESKDVWSDSDVSSETETTNTG